MHMMRISALFVGFGLLVTVGCASPPFPASSLTGGISQVKIDESLTPKVVTAKPGDEVRWVNTTNGSVDLAFLEPLDKRVSCQKGFVSAGWGYLFGTSDPEFLVVATVHSHDSASICFSTPGTYAYTVQIRKTATGTAASLAGTVMIE